jgi:hypothetical protein
MAIHYDNPQCSDTEEFLEDAKRIQYIKRLLKQYSNTNKLRERLILNHLIILINVFGSFHCTRILLHKIQEKYHLLILTFLKYLNVLPSALSHRWDAGVMDKLSRI